MATFQGIINGVINSFKKVIGGNLLSKIKNKINTTIEVMLEKALQIDENYIKNE